MTRMRNAIIVHGKPDRSEYYDPTVPSTSSHHWLPWLSKQLLVRDIHPYRPEMPHAYAPDWAVWCREFERGDITPQTMLVGHSCGAGFLTRWLSEHPEVRVDRVVLVAPWLDPDGRVVPEFFAFAMDPAIASRTAGLTLFDSDDDGDEVRRSARMIRDGIDGVRYRQFHGYGHFCVGDLGGEAFPELLAALVG